MGPMEPYGTPWAMDPMGPHGPHGAPSSSLASTQGRSQRHDQPTTTPPDPDITTATITRFRHRHRYHPQHIFARDSRVETASLPSTAHLCSMAQTASSSSQAAAARIPPPPTRACPSEDAGPPTPTILTAVYNAGAHTEDSFSKKQKWLLQKLYDDVAALDGMGVSIIMVQDLRFFCHGK
jgi:hypothetical protein